VPVRLGAAGPFRFLVDTGSDRTAISRELAAKLGLAPAPHALLHSATGQSHVAMAVIPNLSLSRKAIRRIDAPLLAAADMGADGILGIDSLRSHRVQFDFRARTLSITSAEGPISRDEADAIVVRAQRREGRLVVTDARAAGQHVSVVIDSGSQLSVGNEALRRKLESRGGVHSIGPTDLISVTGAVLRGELVTIDELEIGGVTLHNLVLVFADAHTFRQLRLDRAPALLLGMNGLRSFDRVSLDFASRKLRLVLPRDSVGGRAGSADSNLR
jgi:predicted aspartyl protease